MRQIDEQWVEVIDGQKHMVKETKSENSKIVCPRCLFSDGHGTCNYPEDDCPVQNGYYIKDLGVLNDDGLLPCPFCGEYPENDTKDYCQFGFVVRHVCKNNKTAMGTSNYKTKQEAIDAWNRRA